MDTAIDDGQSILLDASSKFIEQTYPLQLVRDGAYSNASFAADYRRQAGALGWFSMLVPDDLGGGNVSGNGVVDAALIAYTRGRALQPGPFVETNVVAYALSHGGTGEQRAEVLPALISGDESATWLLSTPDVSRAADPIRATQRVDGFVLSGSASFVQDADSSAWFLVGALGDVGAVQLLVPADAPGIRVEVQDALDVTRRFAVVRFESVDVPEEAVVDSRPDAEELVARQLAIASVLTAAETVGAMDRDFDMALEYAKNRIAFGRPIGSFQAIKHLLADTSVMLEMSKAVTLAAAESLGADDCYGLAAASIAKAFVGDAAVELAQNCFQVFGGIGYTWEHDQHLYLRRVTSDAARHGDAAWHRERLCQLAGL